VAGATAPGVGVNAGAARWARVSSILSQALDLPEAQRTAFLTDAISQEPELGGEVLALYAEMRQSDGFLEEGAVAEAPPPPPRLPPGSVLGAYRIEALIGAGGMGEVYRARDERLGRDVAIKILSGPVAGDPALKPRLEIEARALATLSHPNICSVFDVGREGDLAYIVMEYLEGTRLSDLGRGAGLPLEKVLSCGIQIAEALAHAHAHGIVHRDMKGANVIVTPTGTAKVLDFSLARRVGGAAPAAATRTVDFATDPGTVMGTPSYMAPEQMRGRPADARADIWALGVVLHEMAMGAPPFAGATPFEVSAAVLNDPPPPLRAGLPAELRSVIARCLAKDPAGRYARASDVADALAAISARTGRPWRERLRTRRWAAGLGLGVALFAGASAPGIGRRRRPPGKAWPCCPCETCPAIPSRSISRTA
jgi:serine/threonine protein kinase